MIPTKKAAEKGNKLHPPTRQDRATGGDEFPMAGRGLLDRSILRGLMDTAMFFIGIQVIYHYQ